jgi:hypothetical protein
LEPAARIATPGAQPEAFIKHGDARPFGQQATDTSQSALPDAVPAEATATEAAKARGTTHKQQCFEHPLPNMVGIINAGSHVISLVIIIIIVVVVLVKCDYGSG